MRRATKLQIPLVANGIAKPHYLKLECFGGLLLFSAAPWCDMWWAYLSNGNTIVVTIFGLNLVKWEGMRLVQLTVGPLSIGWGCFVQEIEPEVRDASK